jgi:hypothetical protein
MKCKIAGCARVVFIRCAQCRAEVCSDHAEDCEMCARILCPECFRQHSCEQPCASRTSAAAA